MVLDLDQWNIYFLRRQNWDHDRAANTAVIILKSQKIIQTFLGLQQIENPQFRISILHSCTNTSNVKDIAL